MLLSFFIKIGMIVTVIIGSVGLITLFIQAKPLYQYYKSIQWNQFSNLLTVMLGIFFLIFIILKTTNPEYHYDSGLYYIQSIKWIENYPIVPGLGNLHGRFAFNSNWFLLSALFGFGSFLPYRVYILNIFVVLLTGFFLLKKISRLPHDKTNSCIFSLLVFCYSIRNCYIAANSPTTDLPVHLLIWVILVLLLEKNEQSTLSNWDIRSWIIFLLVIFGITIKVSTVPTLLIPLYILINSSRKNRKIFWQVFLIGSLFLIPWLIRNVILSGTILYPLSFLLLPWFDWNIPAINVQEMSKTILSWAMIPWVPKEIVLNLSFLDWFSAWFHNRSVKELISLIASNIGISLFFFMDARYTIKNRHTPYQDHSFWLFLDAFFILSLFYWFISAPDPRFITGLIVSAFMYFILRIFKPLLTTPIPGKILQYIALILMLLFTSRSINQPSFKTNFLFPAKVPIFQTESTLISPGLLIYMPIDGDQCWDAPLPCSKSPYPGLVLRGNTLAEGFKISPSN